MRPAQAPAKSAEPVVSEVNGVLLRLVLGVTGVSLVVASLLRLDWMLQRFLDDLRGELRLPAGLNPVCADAREHRVQVRIDGEHELSPLDCRESASTPYGRRGRGTRRRWFASA
jgi:hypothetical protein